MTNVTTPITPVVGTHFSITNPAVTFTKADGTTMSAVDYLCTFSITIIDGLKAAQSLTKNWIVAMLIGELESLVASLLKQLCPTPAASK